MFTAAIGTTLVSLPCRPDGYLFDKESILECILHQKRESEFDVWEQGVNYKSTSADILVDSFSNSNTHLCHLITHLCHLIAHL